MSRRNFKAAHRLFHLGKFADAERIYRRILRATPDDALALHNLGVALYRQGKVYLAYHAIKQALSHDANTSAFFDSMSEVIEHPDFQDYLRSPFIGPFNGQALRQAMFRELVAAIPPETIFETGTYHGTTTAFMAETTAAHVFTCELSPNYFQFGERRFHANPNITLVNLDSRSFIRQYVPLFASRQASLFYLDAHWDKDDLPLLEELRLVFEYAPRAVILIDDFQVWDDPGYTFDDYGAARRLTLDYLAPLHEFAPRYFFPLASADETHAKRGCLVLTIDPEVAGRLAGLSRLRPAPAPPIVASA